MLYAPLGFSQSRRQSSRLRGAKGYVGGEAGQSLKLSTKAAVFKRESLLIGWPSMSIWGACPPLAPTLVLAEDKRGREMFLADV